MKNPAFKGVDRSGVAVREGYLILFMAFAALGLYYPAILGDFFIMDDPLRMQALINYSWQDITDILGFGASNAYRRPLTLLLHFLIYKMAGDAPITFHLVNVILHLFNGILIYLLVRKLSKDDPRLLWYCLFAALLFIVHPVNVEAVAWISGNSGVMATFFALLALLFHLEAADDSNNWRLKMAALSYFLSMVAKESGLMMILCFAWWDVQRQSNIDLKGAVRRCYMRWVPYGVALGAYLLMRISDSLWTWSKKAAGGGGLVSYFNGLDSIINICTHSIAALGFYLRKLVWPWPLNYHTGTIAYAPYFLVGLAFLLLLIHGMRQRKRQAVWGWFFLCGLLPVVPLTIVNMSWTPVAERYVYLSSAFFAISMALLLKEAGKRKLLATYRYGWIALVVTLLVFGVSTYRRANLWQTSNGMLEATYEQSPHDGWVVYTYGVLFANRGNSEKAEKYWKQAFDLGFIEHAALKLGEIEETRRKYERAEYYYLKAAWPSSDVRKFKRNFDPNVYKALGRLHWTWAIESEESRAKHYKRAIHFYKRAYEFSGHDPMILYTLGKVYLHQGDLERARSSFREVWERMPDTYCGRAAAKLMLAKPKEGGKV
jgi:tetratricopeptide (TPR) repeat protein